PCEDHARDRVEFERGTLQQRGQVLRRPGEDVDGALLEDAAGAGEAGDGVDGAVAGRRGHPFRRAPVVRTDNEHGRTRPGTPPLRRGSNELPQVSRLLHRRRPYQHYRPAALQRGLRVCCRHALLGCQRATEREGWYPAARGKATVPRIPTLKCGLGTTLSLRTVPAEPRL